MANSKTFVRIETTPFPVTEAKFEELKVKVAESVRMVVEKGAVAVARNAKDEFRAFPGGKRVSARSGNTWYSFAPPYQATPPHPTNRSGNLRSSIRTHSVRQIGETRFEATVGTDLDYAPYVEFGTSVMKKEPFMNVGLMKALPELQALFDAEMQKVFL